MHDIVLFCKTHLKEIDRFELLLESVLEYNVDKIPFYVSVPKSDYESFKKYNRNINLVTDESYAGKYFTNSKYWGLSQGYLNQEICKLAFWELNACHNYFCVDSDAYFIKKFYRNDFIYSKKIPYSVLIMDKDLNIEPFYRGFGEWREKMIRKIFKFLNYDDSRFLTCHGMQIINTQVMKDFKSYLEKKKLTYKQLLKYSPYEFTWYNVWLQKSKVIPVIAIEPIFKTFHSKYEYLISRFKLIREADISRKYLGIVMNSNWSKNMIYSYKDPDKFLKIINLFIKWV